MAHQTLNPSGSHRWVKCHYSVAFNLSMDRKYGKIKASNAANEGSIAHHLIEKSLVNKTSIDDELYEYYLLNGYLLYIDQATIDACKMMIDYIGDRCAQLRQDYIVELCVEEYQDLYKAYGIDNMRGGIADCVIKIYNGDQLIAVEIVDYKHGMGEFVNVNYNTQLLMYAAKYAFDAQFVKSSIDEIITTVVQPRQFNNLPKIRSVSYDPYDVTGFIENNIITAAQQINDGSMIVDVSEKSCKFCDHNHRCKKLMDHIMNKTDLNILNITSHNVEELTQDQMLKIWQDRKLIANFLTRVVDHVEDQVITKNNSFGGVLTKTNKPGQRQINEPELRRLVTNNDYGITLLDVQKEPQLITVTQLHKLIRQRVPVQDQDNVYHKLVSNKADKIEVIEISKQQAHSSTQATASFKHLAASKTLGNADKLSKMKG